MSEWNKALDLLKRFERGEHRIPVEAETLVAQILRACGHQVTETGFAASDVGVDCFFDARIGGKSVRIGVEVKTGTKPTGVEAVRQAFAMKHSGHFDRTMVVSRVGFSSEALQRASAEGAGQIDLLAPADLRIWLAKHDPSLRVDAPAHDIVRDCMRQLAIRLSKHPEELAQIEWRDLERLLREVFEGLGYATTLTRSGKDGGFDLELRFSVGNQEMIYLVEVKHWTDQRPGMKHLAKLVEVTASRKASGGLLLSTSGFTKPLYSGLLRLSAPVRVAAGDKVVSLCQAYYRLQTGFWLEATDFLNILEEGTEGSGAMPVRKSSR